MKKFLSILCSAILICFGTFSSMASFAEETTAPTQETTSESEILFPHYEELSAGDVPRVYIDSKNSNVLGLIKETGYIETNIAIVDTNGSIIKDSGLIKVRGNSTASVAKKPFTIKFDNKQNVLGMGKTKKWWLIANCLDPTMLRNELALGLSQNMGIPYTSEHKYAELWLDGVYRGCYQIIEPVDTGKSRVNINVEKEKAETEFLLQFELNRFDPTATYCIADGFRFEIKAPDEPNEAQVEYITATMTEIAKTIKSLNYKEIEKVIDIDSFAKYYLLNEYFKAVDCGFSSMFFYYKNGKLFAGPPWDYDLTTGNLNYDESESYRMCLDTANLYANGAIFFKYLCKCRDFNNAVRHAYVKNYEYFENIYVEGGYIDNIIDKYNPVFQRNFDDTDWIVSHRYWHLIRQPDETYEENVEYLRNWLKERNEWLSEYYDIFGSDWYTVGDINGDSVKSVADAVSLLNFLISKDSLSEVEYLSSDLNSDGEVDIYDMILMRRLLIDETK